MNLPAHTASKGARRARRRRSASGTVAALRQYLGRRLALDADPDGGAAPSHQRVARGAWWSSDAIMDCGHHRRYRHRIILRVSHRTIHFNLATYRTIFIEISFRFLISQRSTRPYLLLRPYSSTCRSRSSSVSSFSPSSMIIGHMSFVRPEWLTRLGVAWKRAMGEMEMIYDGRCGFCVRSMVWFLAFDGLGQIKLRNFRTDPSPIVSDAQMERALYLVLPDGRALPGFEAYRYVVLRVPGLWWQVPLFYVPVLSRLLGHPLYNSIAAHRSLLSSMGSRAVAGASRQRKR